MRYFCRPCALWKYPHIYVQKFNSGQAWSVMSNESAPAITGNISLLNMIFLFLVNQWKPEIYGGYVSFKFQF